jgi:hypothetical protein
MKGTWKSRYRSVGQASRPATKAGAPWAEARRRYARARRQAQGILYSATATVGALFVGGTFLLGRLSVSVIPPAASEPVLLPGWESVGITAQDPSGEVESVALEEENQRLQLVLHERMRAVEWSLRTRHLDRSERPPPPPELLEALSLGKEPGAPSSATGPR